MKVYIIDSSITGKAVKESSVFQKELIEQLAIYGVDYSVIYNQNIERCKLNMQKDSLIIVFNEHAMNEDKENGCIEFLLKAIEKKIEIWPVAIDQNSRKPQGIISKKQSYDVWEQLRSRKLDERYLKTIAKVFSRKIIARTFPTCYCENGEVFLSHRRIDGEEIAAQIYDKMVVQSKETTPFRDVVNVKVGDEAQEVIDREMEKSDIFVFIHTPAAGESDWILKELRFALLRNIPILWVQINDPDIDALKLKPSDKPHLQYQLEDFEKEESIVHIVDEILQKAFELIMDRSNQVLGYIETIENVFGEQLEVVSQEKMIYHVSAVRKGYHYPQRNIEQYYQIFGRTPTLDDARKLKAELNIVDADSIAIITNRVVTCSVQEMVVFDSIQDFCYHWSKYMAEEREEEKSMEIIISGAFPDCDEIYKQSLIDALVLFAKVIIRGGYQLTFGAHPTFQELFFDVAKEIEPKKYKNMLNMYISKWFLEDSDERRKEFNDKCKVFVTDKKEDRLSSLSEMRKVMIQRDEVKAVICLGGKIKKNREEEGIREEIALAREKGIPVFVVGSVGGCSAVVAKEYENNGFVGLNDAAEELNLMFMKDIDYFGMAQNMLNYLK
mgnify:FL=1